MLRLALQVAGFAVYQPLGKRAVRVWQNWCMGRTVLFNLTLAATILSSCARQHGLKLRAADGPCVIDGTVIDERGLPAYRATVSAFPMDGGMAAKVPSADTDEMGHFQLKHLWLGRFEVTAKKEDEGYPDSGSYFYSDGKTDRVTLTSPLQPATVTILLGPKAGILVGTVADAVTGDPLNPCVDFRRASDPNNFASGTGLVNAKYRVLVPSERDVMMKIWSEGHLPWYYPGTSSKSEAKAFCLKPGEERILHIRLHPGNNSADAGCETPLCFPHCQPWN
jgi:hypothetical protein